VTIDAVHVCCVGAELGEGPIWVPHEEALWFVDIAGRRLHRYRPHDKRHDTWTAPQKVSFVLPTRRGDFIVGLPGRLQRFDPITAEFRHYAELEAHLPDNRLNDACVGPDGSVWFGSMHDPQTTQSGALYRADATGCTRKLDAGYVVTNGPAFSPDGTTFFHTDTQRRIIYAFDCSATGTLSRKRILTQIEEGVGIPDGTTVDAEGCLWVAMWRGWAVRRYSPTGELLQSIRFPCANVTKVSFAGADLQTVYVTTAWTGLTAAERGAQPLAGDLFSFRSAVPGVVPGVLEL
jgi:xylono-1,5-lactonase